jgi:two-component system alkaline phosphatase synthesis response regulator PhoP
MNQAKPLKILLVDDESDILEFLSYRLEKEGFQPLATDSGRQAVELAKREKPDLAVLDIMMPEWNGVEVCKRLRSLPEFNKGLVLFITAGSPGFARQAMTQADADDFLLKPVTPQAFVAKLRAILHRNHKLPIEQPDRILDLGHIMLNRDTLEFSSPTRSLKLEPREFELAWMLAAPPRRPYTAYTLASLLGYPASDTASIKPLIHTLREKIGPQHIRLFRDGSYAFEL